MGEVIAAHTVVFLEVADDGGPSFELALDLRRTHRTAVQPAFWLLLSFARDALVHLNAIGCTVAVVCDRPGPPLSSTTGRDLSNAGCWTRHGHLATNSTPEDQTH